MNIFRGETEVLMGGQKRYIKFGINALAFLSEQTGKDLSELGGGLGSIRDLIWSGLKSGAVKRKQDFDFTPYDVGEWIEEMDQSEFDKITEAINYSMPKADDTAAKAKKK